jgi:hypothetical protein
MFFKTLTLCEGKISCNKEPSNYIKKKLPNVLNESNAHSTIENF